jgi:DNA replication and repair protein RecF
VIVSQLSLTDFRNYTSLDVELRRGPNLFVGSNGQGKTNLVESVNYLSTLGSHRVQSDAALIRQDQNAAIIRARLVNGERDLLVEVQINRSQPNRAQINRSAIKTRDLPRYFSSVLFAPEDLALVRGDPSGRRRFMDELLVLRSPRMASVLADYDRVLRQRNTLLKSARASRVATEELATLEIWGERLAQLGSEIIVARSGLVDELAPELARAYAQIAGADHAPRLRNQLSILGADAEAPEVAVETEHGTVASMTLDAATAAFAEALRRVRRAELDRAITLVGPHRDDLVLELNGLPARGYASHGESWSFALALKLASAAILRAESQLGDPVLILDDVFAELDESRRGRLANAIRDYEQVLITAAVFGDVPEELAGHVVQIRAGAVVTDGD